MTAKMAAASNRMGWRRRALHWAGRLGLATVDVGPGAAVLTRPGRVRTTQLDPTTWLVSSGKEAKDVQVHRAGRFGWVLGKPSRSDHAEDELERAIIKSMGDQHVAWILNRYDIDVVLDVGANRGQFSRALRAHGFSGQIHSFEPVPEFFGELEKHAKADPAWTVHQMALGAEAGTVPMHVQRSLSSLLESSELGRDRFRSLREFERAETIDVPVCRLDTILDDVLAPDWARGVARPRIYLKMDTQGFDLQAFAGLGDWIRDVVAMQSEVALLLIYEGMPRMPEAVSAYEAAGFEISGLYPITRQPDGRVIEYDCVMVRAEALPT